MGQDMLGLPSKAGAGASGKGLGPLRTDTSVEAGGDNTPELRKSPIPTVDADQMGLPMADDAGPVMEKGQGSGVFRVHVHSPGGG